MEGLPYKTSLPAGNCKAGEFPRTSFVYKFLICKYSLSCDLKLSDFNIFSLKKKKRKGKKRKGF